MNPDDPAAALPPVPAPAPAPAPRGDSPLTCEFCECHLTPRGHALELSPKAKRWRDHSDDVAKLQAKIEALETTVRTVTAERDALQGAKKKSVFD